MAKVIIDKDTCIGCGACVNACPQNVFDTDDEGKVVTARPKDCIACRACEGPLSR